MIFLVLVPFLVTTISALCLPDPPFCNQNHQSEFDQNKAYLKNGHYHQLPYKTPGYLEAFYGANPDIAEEGNIPEQWRGDFNLEGPQNDDIYSEFMSGVPKTYEYNNGYNQKGGKYIQEKVSESTELVDDQLKDQQRYSSPQPGGSVNCKPSAGLYTNYFYGSDNSDLYGLALPHIYTSKYLENLKNLREHGFLRDVKLRKYIEHNKEEKNRMRKEMERLRGVYGSKWEQLQNVYTPRYLAYLESLYQPNFLKNIDIYDQSQKLAMFKNFNRNKYWRTLLAPEYSPQGVIQHIISFLHNLRNRHPTSFLQYFHPNENFQWVPYPWTHGHQQVPVGQHFPTEPFVGNRFDGNDEKHIIGPVTENKNKTSNVDIRFDDGKVEVATTADKKDGNGNKNTDSKIIKEDGDQKGSQVEKIEGSSVSHGGIGIEVTGGTNPLGIVETNTDGNNSNKAGSTAQTVEISGVPPIKSFTSEGKITEAEANIGVKANTLLSKVVNEFDKASVP